MPFDTNTRLKYIRMPSMARPAGGGTTQVDLPRSGILQKIYLNITGTIGGTVGAVNANGFCSIIKRVRLTLNSGVDLFNISGPGYHYLLREQNDVYSDPVPQSNGRVAITAIATNLDMVLPVAINSKDPIGLVMLQNEQTLATLVVEWEADATVTATGTFTSFQVTPMLAVFEVPNNVKDWPPLNILHTCIEDTQAIPGATDYTYNWPRGNTYLSVNHFLSTVAWTRAQLRVQQSIYLADVTPGLHTILANSQTVGRDLTLASPSVITGNDKRIFWDFSGSDGLGMFGTVRDVVDSSRLTDIASIITVGGAATLLTQRRQLITLG